MAERKTFLLRLDPSVFNALQRWASTDLRSLNGQIEYLLKEAVARHRRTIDEKPKKGKGESGT